MKTSEIIMEAILVYIAIALALTVAAMIVEIPMIGAYMLCASPAVTIVLFGISLIVEEIEWRKERKERKEEEGL